MVFNSGYIFPANAPNLKAEQEADGDAKGETHAATDSNIEQLSRGQINGNLVPPEHIVVPDRGAYLEKAQCGIKQE